MIGVPDSLQVAARTSSFAFADTDEDIRDIGRKLEVANVLEGSIRKAGNNIRVTAQLIEVETGYHLWSETYDRAYEDIFKIQDEISASILSALKVHLLGEEEIKVPEAERQVNLDAYNAYLIGRERLAKRTKEDLEAAIEKFDESIAIDPEYAPAHANKAHAMLTLESYRFGGSGPPVAEEDTVIRVI